MSKPHQISLPSVPLVLLAGWFCSGCGTVNFQGALAKSSRGVIPAAAIKERGPDWNAVVTVDEEIGTSLDLLADGHERRISSVEAEDWWRGEDMTILTLVGEVCVAYNRPVDNRVGEISFDQERAKAAVEFVNDKEEFWVETFESLTNLPDRPLVIKERATRLKAVRAMQGFKAKSYAGYRFTKRGEYQQRTNVSSFETWIFVLCGRAPELTASTRFLTVSGSSGTLFVWELSDDDAASIHRRIRVTARSAPERPRRWPAAAR